MQTTLLPAPMHRPFSEPPRLTNRQSVALRLIASGASTADIAAELHLTPNSAKDLVRLLMGKIGAFRQEHAAALGAAYRLVQSADIQPDGQRERLSLDDRDVQVLRLVAGGSSVQQIAAELYFSVKTISLRLSSIVAVLGARNRAHAAALGVVRNLVLLNDLDPTWPPVPLSSQAP